MSFQQIYSEVKKVKTETEIRLISVLEDRHVNKLKFTPRDGATNPINMCVYDKKSLLSSLSKVDYQTSKEVEISL